jgi:hypothetical protein
MPAISTLRHRAISPATAENTADWLPPRAASDRHPPQSLSLAGEGLEPVSQAQRNRD